MKKTFASSYRVKACWAAAISVLLASCGGDQLAVAPTGGGTGSTIDNGVFVVVGPITKLSPLTVNGVEFNTAAATVVIESGDVVRDGLQLGMIARVDARTASSNALVQARSVAVSAELRAPISEINVAAQTIKSQGVIVEIDRSTQFEGATTSLSALTTSDFVQVHGFPSGDNRIRATLITKRAAAREVKLIATIEATSCSGCRAGERDFLAAGNVVQVSSSTNIGRTPLAAGSLVKIIGERVDETLIVAQEVAPYKIAEAPLDGSRITIQGLVSSAAGNGDFKLTGLPVQTSANTQIIDPLRFGATVVTGNLLEVEGQQLDGVVKATRVTRR